MPRKVSPIAAKSAALSVEKSTAPRRKSPASKPTKAAASEPLAAPSPIHAAETLPSLVVKSKDIVDRVCAATGLKKAEVRKSVEATLAEIGAALARGETLQAPPLGKIKVQRRKPQAKGEMMIVKLHYSGPPSASNSALAAD